MRPIKFRCWTGKAMQPVGGYWWEEAAINSENLEDLAAPHTGCNAIMQYTGVDDRKGVEIYEGDILTSDIEMSFTEETRIFYKVLWGLDLDGEQFKIFSDQAGFVLEAFNKQDGTLFHINLTRAFIAAMQYEVVSNIFIESKADEN